jgi:hypothetical protein
MLGSANKHTFYFQTYIFFVADCSKVGCNFSTMYHFLTLHHTPQTALRVVKQTSQ